MYRLFLAAAAASVIAVPSAFAEGEMTMTTLKADQIGQIFCLSRIGNDEAVLDGILTADLKAAIADAWAKDEAWETANPGEKPPLGDGIPWAAWPDYASECTVGLVSLMKTDARVEISYSFPEDPAANFTDTLLLKKIDQPGYGVGFWRIDNLAYATGGDLKSQLIAAFAP
jgi:hypothetical protein